MSKTIPLSQGKVALVDAQDFEWLSQWKWTASQEGRDSWYAIRHDYSIHPPRMVRMHRIILNVPLGMEPDHINCDGLDNRRANLRTATSSQNHANSRKRANCSSRYKGVYWHKRDRKWHSRVQINGRRQHLGFFDDEVEAAQAYNEAAIEVFGEFARLNEIERQTRQRASRRRRGDQA